MQTCFFAISGILPRDEAIDKIKEAIRKTYGKRGEAIVRKNFAAVDAAVMHLHEVDVPDRATSQIDLPPVVPAAAPAFVEVASPSSSLLGALGCTVELTDESGRRMTIRSSMGMDAVGLVTAFCGEATCSR